MVDVADNQQSGPGDPESRPPAVRPQAPPPAAAGATPPAQPLSAEEAERWRQFQEFQRFQEFRDSSQFGEAPEPDRPRRRGRPVWKKLLLSKWLRRLAFLLVVVLAANWAYEKYFGNPDENLPASVTGGFKTERTVLFATDPKEAIRAFYDNVAQETLPDACTRFETEAVERSFANHFNAPDCATAVRRLHAEVTGKNDYAEVYFPTDVSLAPGPDKTVVVSSCDLEVSAGPRLGRFTVKVIEGSRGDQWTISRHERETC